jgi:hypothetical protein
MAKVAVIGLGLVLLLGLATPAVADEMKWSAVSIPSEGKSGNWVLASGSDIQQLTMSASGDLYAYGRGLTYTLYKSTDGGYRWSYTGQIEDDIIAIATAPDDADTVYYTTVSNVFKSTDGGLQSSQMAENPGGAGNSNIEITAIDVTTLGGDNIIAVATRDRDNSEFGGVYTLNESRPFSGWIDTSIGNYDVYAVAFSPDFATDQQLVAVATDETDTFVTTMIGASTWGQTVGDARLNKDNSGASVAVDTSASIVFPNDYDANVITGCHVQFVAIDAGNGNGDVYMVTGVEAPDSSVATDLNIGTSYGLSNVDITGLAIEGNATNADLLAGAAGSAEVYLSTDGGGNWTRSSKPPTGQSKTCVVMLPDFAESGQAYAATSGSGSAVSITKDGGTTWNQIGLIDTEISNIIDLTPSPDYGKDDTLFMLTWGGKHSLWRTSNGGRSWERVYTATLPGIDQIDRIEFPPDYDNGNQVVFIAGSSNGNPAIWKSTDNSQEFSHRSTPLPIDTWAVANDKTLFIGSYDGSNGLVYRTINGGLSYSTGAVAGNQSLNSIATSPDYDNDKTILIGNTNGWVYVSNDSGSSFEPVPPDAVSPPLTGNVVVAFDRSFSKNKTIYAASDTADKGIYRFIIGESTI